MSCVGLKRALTIRNAERSRTPFGGGASGQTGSGGWPRAMGESHQVGSDKTAEGQAQSRRVVVRVLQNKGIAGT